MSDVANLVCGNFRFYPGTVCRVFINDIPVFQGFEGNGFSNNTGINHFLVPGENTLAIEILAAPPPIGGRLAYEPDPRPQANGADDNQTVEVAIFKGRPDAPGEVEILYQCMFPDLWQHVPEERRHMPYMHVATFDPGVTVAELSFLSSPPVSMPCEGISELHDAVRELHAAFSGQDATRLKSLMTLQMTEYERAYGGGAGASMGDQRAGHRRARRRANGGGAARLGADALSHRAAGGAWCMSSGSIGKAGDRRQDDRQAARARVRPGVHAKAGAMAVDVRSS